MNDCAGFLCHLVPCDEIGMMIRFTDYDFIAGIEMRQ
jgi:hypothetical protein